MYYTLKLLKSILIGLLALLAIGSVQAFINIPVSAQVTQETSLIHRRLFDDVTGHNLGWDPDGTRKAFGIVDSKFNVQTSVVLINTINFNFVVCSVDYRAETPVSSAFEVNCGNDDPDAAAPLDGSVLDYIIINMPLSPPDEQVVQPLSANIIERMQIANQTQSGTNMTERMQIANQTQSSP